MPPASAAGRLSFDLEVDVLPLWMPPASAGRRFSFDLTWRARHLDRPGFSCGSLRFDLDMKNELRIVIADDHPIVRHGLREMIEEDSSLTVVGEAGDGLKALSQIEQLKPDVTVLDIDMPKMDGLAVAREIKQRG